MKKIILLSFSIFISAVAFAQQDKPTEEYSKKVWNDITNKWEYEYDYRPDAVRKNRKKEHGQLSFNSTRLVTGVSFIGGGATLYLIGSGAINQRTNAISKEIAEMTSGSNYRQNELAGKQDKLKSLDKSKRIITWISGAAVLSGTIVAICSIGSEKVTPEGFVVGQNMYLKDSGAGLAFSYKF